MRTACIEPPLVIVAAMTIVDTAQLESVRPPSGLARGTKNVRPTTSSLKGSPHCDRRGWQAGLALGPVGLSSVL